MKRIGGEYNPLASGRLYGTARQDPPWHTMHQGTDGTGGVEPGTAFESLPDDWVCPVCGAAKDEFSPAP